MVYSVAVFLKGYGLTILGSVSVVLAYGIFNFYLQITSENSGSGGCITCGDPHIRTLDGR